MTGIQSQTIVFKKSFLAQIILYQQQLFKSNILGNIVFEILYFILFIHFSLVLNLVLQTAL